MWKTIVFTVVTIALAYISRASLTQPRTHGFYRFFAWVFILTLFLLNVEYWFIDPFAWNQIAAWILLCASLFPLFFGVHALRTRGTPAGSRRKDPSLLAFEKTSQLVTSGIYRHIRHPLYSSLLLLAWGTFFKHPGWIGGLLGTIATFLLLATAKADETECIQFFGEPYQDYMGRTKRFIPFIF